MISLPSNIKNAFSERFGIYGTVPCWNPDQDWEKKCPKSDTFLGGILLWQGWRTYFMAICHSSWSLQLHLYGCSEILLTDLCVWSRDFIPHANVKFSLHFFPRFCAVLPSDTQLIMIVTIGGNTQKNQLLLWVQFFTTLRLLYSYHISVIRQNDPCICHKSF